MNGSSATGHCSSVTTGQGASRDLTRCDAPNTSVLFDGNITIVTGDMWARQLLTLMGDTFIDFNFNGTPGYAGVEGIKLNMVNCSEWGISVQEITFSGILTACTIDTVAIPPVTH